MSWWVYKCNSRNLPHQRHFGDWDDFFAKGIVTHWGTTEIVPALADLKRGDQILAFQSDRNELVGIAIVRESSEADTHVHLEPIQEVRVKVRPLKQVDPRIAEIAAFKPGVVKTLYEIRESEVRWLLEAAGVHLPGVAGTRRSVKAHR
jgi:hypothetical protein